MTPLPEKINVPVIFSLPPKQPHLSAYQERFPLRLKSIYPKIPEKQAKSGKGPGSAPRPPPEKTPRATGERRLPRYALCALCALCALYARMPHAPPTGMNDRIRRDCGYPVRTGGNIAAERPLPPGRAVRRSPAESPRCAPRRPGDRTPAWQGAWMREP